MRATQPFTADLLADVVPELGNGATGGELVARDTGYTLQ